MTRQERFMIGWLRFLTLAFIVLGVLLANQPHYFFHYLDSIGLVFFNYNSQPVEPHPFDLWWVLTFSLLIVLVTISFQAQRDWLRYSIFVPLLILAKGVSFIGFLFLTLTSPIHFFYIVGAAVDGFLFLTTLYFYAQAEKSRSFISPHSN